MAVYSRIKFNPVTKEIEVEGTETFVKAYFHKLQAMLLEEPFKKEKPQAVPKQSAKKTTNTEKVLSLVQGRPDGITTEELKKKTGLTEHQIWNIVNASAKVGKVVKLKRGVYAGAIPPAELPLT